MCVCTHVYLHMNGVYVAFFPHVWMLHVFFRACFLFVLVLVFHVCVWMVCVCVCVWLHP